MRLRLSVPPRPLLTPSRAREPSKVVNAVIVSTLPFGSGAPALERQRLTRSTSAPFRARQSTCIRPVMRDDHEGSGLVVPVSRRLSTRRHSLPGSSCSLPGTWASLTVGIPDQRPDPDGVVTFRTVETRPGWVLYGPRRCRPSRRGQCVPGQISELPAGRRSHPRRPHPASRRAGRDARRPGDPRDQQGRVPVAVRDVGEDEHVRVAHRSAHPERRFHTGTDYAAADGTPIFAVADGVVTVAGSPAGTRAHRHRAHHRRAAGRLRVCAYVGAGHPRLGR